MTAGSRLVDDRVSLDCYVRYFPSNVVEHLSPKLCGAYYYRWWSGADRPKTPRKFVTIYWEPPAWYRANKRTAWKSVKTQRVISKRLYLDEPHHKRDLSPHPYRMFVQEYNYGRVDMHFYNADHSLASIEYTCFTGLRSPIGNAYSYLNANDRLKCIERLRKKIEGSDFNLGVFLAEAGQAAGMIGDAAQRIARAMYYVSNGNIVKAAGVLVHGTARHNVKRPPSKAKNLAGRWLELQYGWLPLLSDIHGAAEFLGKALNEPFEQEYRARIKVGLNYPPTEWEDDHTGSVDRLQIIALVKEVDIPQLIGLTDPLGIAWEKLPFSFIADWFIPISSYLSARSLNTSLKATFITTYTSNEQCTYYPTSDDQPKFFLPDGNIKMKYYYLDRTVSDTLDVPLPRIKPWYQISSWKHAANSVALVIQGAAGDFHYRR